MTGVLFLVPCSIFVGKCMRLTSIPGDVLSCPVARANKGIPKVAMLKPPAEEGGARLAVLSSPPTVESNAGLGS